MTRHSVTDSLERIIAHLLRSSPDLARDVAIVAAWAADVAACIADHPVSPAETPAPLSPVEPEPLRVAQPPHIPTPATPPPLPQQKVVTPRPAPTAFVPLIVGGQMQHVKVPGTSAEIAAARFSAMEQPKPVQPDFVTSVPDLALIAERCDLKAQGCIAAMERRNASGTDAEYNAVGRVKAILERAKQLPNCFIWATFPTYEQPTDDVLKLCARVYENLALAARLCIAVPATANADRRREALGLLAEAQAALRVCLHDTWLTRADMDQEEAFQCLREATTHEQIFIDRHMRLDDAPDPGAWANLRTRIENTLNALEQTNAIKKRTRALLNTVRHHARKVLEDPAADHTHDWMKIEATIASLQEAGVNAASRDVADAIGAAREMLPNDVRWPSLQSLHAQQHATPAVEDDQPARDYGEQVLRVRGVLDGRRIVIVGGERREDAIERYREAFGCSEVVWVELTEHGPSYPAQAPIAQPATTVVFLLIRLAGHQHTEDIARFCDHASVPLIRLPAGYNPGQAASQFLAQASRRFGLEGAA